IEGSFTAGYDAPRHAARGAVPARAGGRAHATQTVPGSILMPSVDHAGLVEVYPAQQVDRPGELVILDLVRVAGLGADRCAGGRRDHLRLGRRRRRPVGVLEGAPEVRLAPALLLDLLDLGRLDHDVRRDA